MGDEKGLHKLGEEFCTVVRAKIQSKYKDIQERLDILLKLIQKKKDSTAITTELDRIEKALKDKKEYNQTIRDCEKKIRAFWDVNKGKKTGTAEKRINDPQNTMADEKGLQKLGEEFCTAVRAKIQTKYTDIQERLDNLMKVIKNKKDATNITIELDRIEEALKDKNEFNPTIGECEKKIRDFWRLPRKAVTGGPESTHQIGKHPPAKRTTSDTAAVSSNDVGLGANTGTKPSSGNNEQKAGIVKKKKEIYHRKQKKVNPSIGQIPSGHADSVTSDSGLRKGSPTSGPEMTDEEEQRLKHLGEL